MKRSHVLGFILISLLLSCQQKPHTDQEAPALYSNLYVRYLQENQQIKAEASFYQLDSLQQAIPIKIDGGVSFLGSGMGMREFPSGQLIRYQYENRMDYPDQLRFRMQDLAGSAQEFSLSFAPLDTFLLASSIERKQPASLQLFSGPLRENQELVFLFNDAESNAFSFAIGGPSQSEKIQLPEDELQKLAPGEYELYLVKKERKTFDRPGIKAALEAEYYSKTRRILIK